MKALSIRRFLVSPASWIFDPLRLVGCVFCLLWVQAIGCIPGYKLPRGPLDTKKSYYDKVSTRIEYPDVAVAANAGSISASTTAAPLTLQDPSQLPSWNLSLEEAIQMAVAQGPVIRTLGGSTTTAFDPSIAEANPLGGVEAALADFDAQVSGGLFWQKNNRAANIDPNNPVLRQFQRLALKQTQANYTSQISKKTATGASFAARHNITYDRPNNPGRFLRSDFNGFVEAEWRQPLGRGQGTLYNRIAGPNSAVGQYNGVLIARVNQDISLTRFEAGVIQLATDVEQAYWDLYFAYRNLEAQLRGRESALQTFQYQELRVEVGAGRRDEEAQAKSQYYQFQVQVENGLAGEQGLYTAEQKLRLLLGLPASDGRLIKPVTDPHDARVVFQWDSALQQGLERHVSIREQMWNVKRRELELCAAKLNKRPQFDFLGQYRWRGLGDHLIGSRSQGALDNLYAEILGGDFQEWQAGLELSFPVGMRKASVAIGHAQLNLARERSLLGESQLQVSHNLANATRQLERQYQLLKTSYNRWSADRTQLTVLRERYLRGADNINFLLQAQRQVVVSESEYYRALVNYNLAIRDLHVRKGSLLAYNHIHLAESTWGGAAHCEAYERGRSLAPCRLPANVVAPRPVSRGSFDPSTSVPSPVVTSVFSSDVPGSEPSILPVSTAIDGSLRIESASAITSGIEPAAPIRLPATNETSDSSGRPSRHIGL